MPQIAMIASCESAGSNLGPAAQRHIDLAFRELLRGPGATVDASMVRLVTGEPHPFANFVLQRCSHDADAMRVAIAPLVERNAPAAVIATEPVSDAVRAVLGGAGFESHDPMPAMAVDIARLPMLSLADGYAFERIEPSASSQEWGDAFVRGYELPPAIAVSFSPDPARPGCRPDDVIQWFAVRRAGAIVATTVLLLAGGLAGIYAVSTLRDHRRRGLGAFLTVEACRAAARAGYRVGVLQASPDGYPVYAKLGFTTVGAVPLYVRMPA